MKGNRVTRFYIFVLRTILGAAFAVILMRVFYPRSPIVYTMILWVFLVGMAYLLEYFRSKNRVFADKHDQGVRHR